MIGGGKVEKFGASLPQCYCSHESDTSHPGLNRTLCGDKPVPNHLSYGIAEICSSLIDYFKLG